MIEIIKEYTLPIFDRKHFKNEIMVDIHNYTLFIKYSLNRNLIYVNGEWIKIKNFNDKKYHKQGTMSWFIIK